eukprot:TRINITY_DN16606_c0_g1_i3.p2 TRINITY_DN16606_c0_g1~~TRINITY_DN16606_c0_g1_i3.p2  ORF type:complete len:141 (+),score=23.59 TRINITY_DN16606_c0_g1_i3:71-493(+)
MFKNEILRQILRLSGNFVLEVVFGVYSEGLLTVSDLVVFLAGVGGGVPLVPAAAAEAVQDAGADATADTADAATKEEQDDGSKNKPTQMLDGIHHQHSNPNPRPAATPCVLSQYPTTERHWSSFRHFPPQMLSIRPFSSF